MSAARAPDAAQDSPAGAAARGLTPASARLPAGPENFWAPFARNPLISPDSRKFFADFGNGLKFLEAFLEGNRSLWQESEGNGIARSGHPPTSLEERGRGRRVSKGAPARAEISAPWNIFGDAMPPIAP